MGVGTTDCRGFHRVGGEPFCADLRHLRVLRDNGLQHGGAHLHRLLHKIIEPADLFQRRESNRRGQDFAGCGRVCSTRFEPHGLLRLRRNALPSHSPSRPLNSKSSRRLRPCAAHCARCDSVRGSPRRPLPRRGSAARRAAASCNWRALSRNGGRAFGRSSVLETSGFSRSLVRGMFSMGVFVWTGRFLFFCACCCLTWRAGRGIPWNSDCRSLREKPRLRSRSASPPILHPRPDRGRRADCLLPTRYLVWMTIISLIRFSSWVDSRRVLQSERQVPDLGYRQIPQSEFYLKEASRQRPAKLSTVAIDRERKACRDDCSVIDGSHGHQSVGGRHGPLCRNADCPSRSLGRRASPPLCRSPPPISPPAPEHASRRTPGVSPLAHAELKQRLRARMPHRPISLARAPRCRRRRDHAHFTCSERLEIRNLVVAEERPAQCACRRAVRSRPCRRRSPHRRAAFSTHAGRVSTILPPEASLSPCSRASISGAFGSAMPKASPKRAVNSFALCRWQKKQGRCPAASAVTSSRKKSSVQPALPPGRLRPIGSRRRPWNSQRQMIQAFSAQRRFSSVFVAGSWMMPRLPVNSPRAATAWMSPNGSTRFCSGISVPSFWPPAPYDIRLRHAHLIRSSLSPRAGSHAGFGRSEFRQYRPWPGRRGARGSRRGARHPQRASRRCRCRKALPATMRLSCLAAARTRSTTRPFPISRRCLR